MKTVQMFQADDGTLFNNRDDAKQHDAVNEAVEKLVPLIRESLSTGRCESIARHILLHGKPVKDVITSYHRKLPKSKR